MIQFENKEINWSELFCFPFQTPSPLRIPIKRRRKGEVGGGGRGSVQVLLAAVLWEQDCVKMGSPSALSWYSVNTNCSLFSRKTLVHS